jgi:DNA-binding transcriptional MerR regulator
VATFARHGTHAEIVGLNEASNELHECLSGRSHGGFRLYTGGDIDRLVQIKAMKPLGFSLDEISEVLELRMAVQSGLANADTATRLSAYVERARLKSDERQRQLDNAHPLVDVLTSDLDYRVAGHR